MMMATTSPHIGFGRAHLPSPVVEFDIATRSMAAWQSVPVILTSPVLAFVLSSLLLKNIFFLFLTSFYNQNLPKMAGNGSTPDEELEEALRMSMMVDDNTTSGTEPQSNSTTEVGGTQSRSTASPEDFAQMFAFCLATAIQQSLSPTHVESRA